MSERSFEVPKQEVLIGDLEKNSEAMKVVMPKLNNEIFLYASVREGMDELTLREREAGTLRFFSRWWPPILDEDWHTQCVNPSTKASEGAEWENLCYKFKELNIEVNVRDLVGSSRANSLWKLIDAQNIGDTYFFT